MLKHKPLFLRGCWKSDNLSFDHSGKLAQPSPRIPFSLCGIDVENAAFEGDELKIRGRRVGIEYNKTGTPRRVDLGSMYSTEKIEIHVAGHSGEDFGPALQQIFAPDLASLVPSTKAYWLTLGQQYVQQKLAPGESADVATPHSDPPVPTPDEAKNTKPPVLINSFTPKFSEAAHLLDYSGTVQISVWVEPSGLPSNLEVIQPAGLGLDELALAAVAGYRFRPAMKDGVAIPVKLFIPVGFSQR